MILSDEDYDFIYSRSPRICVDLIIRRGKKVFMTKRDIPPYKGKWHIPGGRIRFRETFQQAVKRIASGEIKGKFKIVKTIGFMEFLREVQNGRPRHSVSIAVVVEGSFDKSCGQFCDINTENVLPVQREFLIKNKIL